MPEARRFCGLRLALLSALFMAACGPLIPARTPVQLAHTPGPPIAIDSRSIRGAQWQVEDPPGWRVVRINTAAEPLRLVFVSPDEDPEQAIIITLSEAPFPDSQRIQRGWRFVYVHSAGPASRTAERLVALRRVLASLRPL